MMRFYGFNEPLTPYRSPKIVFMDTGNQITLITSL